MSAVELKDPVLDATDPQTRLLLLAEHWKRKYQELALAAPAQGALPDALPVDIYGRPVAWRVHLRARGEAPTVDYDQPALFKVERSAESWMHGKIDFDGWRGAWMEPLYLRPAAAIRAQQYTVSDAARWNWIRDISNSDEAAKLIPRFIGCDLDTLVDAAIQDQAGDAMKGGDHG